MCNDMGGLAAELIEIKAVDVESKAPHLEYTCQYADHSGCVTERI